jgi:hypothetical protein
MTISKHKAYQVEVDATYVRRRRAADPFNESLDLPGLEDKTNREYEEDTTAQKLLVMQK